MDPVRSRFQKEARNGPVALRVNKARKGERCRMQRKKDHVPEPKNLRPAPPDHPETGSRSEKDSANRRSIREPKNTPPDEPAGLLYRLLPKENPRKTGT